MDVKKLKETMELFKNYLGDGLISSDIWDKKDGLSVASYQTNDRFSALFARILKNTETSLKDLDFPSFGEYQITELNDDKLLLIINYENNYFWGSLIDKSKISLGTLIFVVITKVKEALKEAIDN
jgi:hypothetical protein